MNAVPAKQMSTWCGRNVMKFFQAERTLVLRGNAGLTLAGA